MKHTARLHKFFLQPLPADTLGLFRIAVSGFALVQLLVLLPDWMWLYGPKGILPWEVSEALATNDMPSLPTIFKLPHRSTTGRPLLSQHRLPGT